GRRPEELEERVDVPFDAALLRPPARARDRARQRLDLEVLFHVHGEEVLDPSRSRSARRPAGATGKLGARRAAARPDPSAGFRRPDAVAPPQRTGASGRSRGAGAASGALRARRAPAAPGTTAPTGPTGARAAPTRVPSLHERRPRQFRWR